VRASQVLPGRTHPLMTSKGGSEGFVFTARRAIPIEGGVEARGNHVGKKRKAETQGGAEDD
jgi:tRNA (adenine-N(1)-)-methyltransferase non-catalytic subunit